MCGKAEMMMRNEKKYIISNNSITFYLWQMNFQQKIISNIFTDHNILFIPNMFFAFVLFQQFCTQCFTERGKKERGREKENNAQTHKRSDIMCLLAFQIK